MRRLLRSSCNGASLTVGMVVAKVHFLCPREVCVCLGCLGARQRRTEPSEAMLLPQLRRHESRGPLRRG